MEAMVQKKYISLRSTGNLGNQMFQFAAAKYLAVKYAQKYNCTEPQILIELGGSFKNDNLADFNAKYTIVNKSKRSLVQLFLRNAMHFIRYAVLKADVDKVQKFQKTIQKLLNYFGVYYYSYGYYPFKIKQKKYSCIEGYFETPLYSDEIKEIIIESFTPVHAENKENAKLYDAIRNTNSVCVSVRRGDFVTGENDANAQDCNVCTINYFEYAIKYCKENLNNPVFFFFSDDVQWVKENFDFIDNEEVYFESGNDAVYEKLRLMYNCKNFIMSNSTFSFWAQYLSQSENKLVIAPNRWRNVTKNDEIYMKNWVCIGTD